jgi:outer membrane protein X
MKKFIILIAIATFGMNSVKAQTLVGGGLAIWDDTALEVKADFAISDQFSVSPSFDYLFANYGSHFIINADAHYNLGDIDEINYYPLLGLNYNYTSIDLGSYGTVSDGSIGLNLGGGLNYAISESMKLYGELKFMSNDHMANSLGASFGILFSL